MLTARRIEADRGSVLLLFPTAVLVMTVLGALVIDASLTQVRARELELVAASAANDALAALDIDALRTDGKFSFDPATAEKVVADAIAAGPLPAASIDTIAVIEAPDRPPQIRVTLTLVVELVMAPALPGHLTTTTITRTGTATIVG